MLSRRRIEGVEKRQHIGGSDTDTVARTRDEPELQPSGGIVGGEELFVACAVGADVGDEVGAAAGEALVRVAGVQDFERDVLHASSVPCEVPADSGRGIGGDEHECDTAGGDTSDAVVWFGEWHLVEPELLDHRIDGGAQVGYGDHHMVDPAHHRVDPGTVAGIRCLVGRRFRASAGNFDAVRLGEQHTEQLLCKVGIDAGVDGELASRLDDGANTCRLNDGGVEALLHCGNLVTHLKALGDDGDQLPIERVDTFAEGSQFGVHVAGRRIRHR